MIFKTLRFILSHPLNKSDKMDALFVFLRWQIVSRLSSSSILVPYVNGSLVAASRGMTGMTGNIYCGLHEYETMLFLLHYLKEGDVFFDVGANVGSYSVLAATKRAQCFAFEPIDKAYRSLGLNIRINKFDERIHAFKLAVGEKKAQVIMTSNLDTMNKIGAESASGQNSVAVDMICLDEFCDHDLAADVRPNIVKIDVEGYELEVLIGAKRMLKANEKCHALIVEVKSSRTHDWLIEMGYFPVEYDPSLKKINALERFKSEGNTIYINNLIEVQKRLALASISNVTFFGSKRCVSC